MLLQVPPFIQRLVGLHSFASSSHNVPVYSGVQEQLNPPLKLLQVPIFMQGFVGIHSFMSTPQKSPV